MEVTKDNVDTLNINKINIDGDDYFVYFDKSKKEVKFSKKGDFENSTFWSYNDAIKRGCFQNIIEYNKLNLVLW
jgi:hypothetical protein